MFRAQLSLISPVANSAREYISPDSPLPRIDPSLVPAYYFYCTSLEYFPASHVALQRAFRAIQFPLPFSLLRRYRRHRYGGLASVPAARRSQQQAAGSGQIVSLPLSPAGRIEPEAAECHNRKRFV